MERAIFNFDVSLISEELKLLTLFPVCWSIEVTQTFFQLTINVVL